MYYILMGMINSIILLFYMSGALVPRQNKLWMAPITHFLHKYFYWYFEFKIAHILSVAFICYAIILLVKRKINIGLFIIGVILNIFWMIIYIFAYMN